MKVWAGCSGPLEILVQCIGKNGLLKKISPIHFLDHMAGKRRRDLLQNDTFDD